MLIRTIMCAICNQSLRATYVPLDDSWRAYCCNIQYIESADTPRYFLNDKGINAKWDCRRCGASFVNNQELHEHINDHRTADRLWPDKQHGWFEPEWNPAE